MEPLHIWVNHKFSDADADFLRAEALPNIVNFSSATTASNLSAGEPDSAAREADVLFGQPDPQDVLASTNVRWVQLTSAGYTRYEAFLGQLRDRGIAICNASSVFNEPCAQHALALLMATARALPDAVTNEFAKKWDMRPIRRQCFLLGGQKTLLVGYGAIAKRLAELLSPFGMDLTAFRRTVRGDENVKTLPIDQLDAHLPTADIVFNTLPAAAATKMLFNADRLAMLKPTAVYISIGRGDTTDQAALRELLAAGKIGHAYLDVTTPEPLPADDPLWTTPHCHITPHTAGGTFDEYRRLIDHFLANLRRFERGEPLVNRL